MNKSKINIIIILFLMIITGFIIYFMYLKPETFDCTTNPTDPACTKRPTNAACNCNGDDSAIPTSIISRYFGVGFNVYPVSLTTSSTNKAFLIEHIPINQSGVLGSMYAVSSDGLLTIKIKDETDTSQWWNIVTLTDTTNNTNYLVIQPFGNTSFALQYANGNLSLTPYTSPGFEGQKWLSSNNTVSRSISVLNNNPGGMFTTEFNPYSESSINSNNLSDANNKQVTDVINAVKSGIQRYLATTNSNSQMTTSALGNKDMPLSINLNLGNSDSQGISYFSDVTGSTSSSDILSFLDKYEKNTENDNNNNKTIYSTGDLENQLNQTSTGCKLFNLNEYTNNRVSTCNCKL